MIFFFNDTATTEIYTLSLHDALPISSDNVSSLKSFMNFSMTLGVIFSTFNPASRRSEEHTSELQSHSDLVCRLLLEKKKKKIIQVPHTLHKFHILSATTVYSYDLSHA